MAFAQKPMEMCKTLLFVRSPSRAIRHHPSNRLQLKVLHSAKLLAGRHLLAVRLLTHMRVPIPGGCAHLKKLLAGLSLFLFALAFGTPAKADSMGTPTLPDCGGGSEFPGPHYKINIPGTAPTLLIQP